VAAPSPVQLRGAHRAEKHRRSFGLLVRRAVWRRRHGTDQSGTGGTQQTLVEAKFEAWAAGTGSPYELLADDAIWTITGNSLASKTYGSREAFMREVIRPFNARMSIGLKPTIRNIYADGDTVIVFFEASGTARDSLPYENTYAWFLEMQGGNATRAFAFFDSVAFNDFWQRVSPAPRQ
jgi:ketosteroid isomerase-like protein